VSRALATESVLGCRMAAGDLFRSAWLPEGVHGRWRGQMNSHLPGLSGGEREPGDERAPKRRGAASESAPTRAGEFPGTARERPGANAGAPSPAAADAPDGTGRRATGRERKGGPGEPRAEGSEQGTEGPQTHPPTQKTPAGRRDGPAVRAARPEARPTATTGPHVRPSGGEVAWR